MCIEITKEIQNRAEANFGNPYRLLKLFEKARRGKPISFVALGGSVTMGCHATTNEKTYAAQIALWFREKFPKCKVKFENAGIGATGSVIALHRLKQDVFKYEPDFVVVEFSVNEGNDDEIKLAYDNLIYNLLNFKTNPAVLLLCLMTNNGGNAQYVHSQVGKHYDLPIISYRDALWCEIEAGNLKWNDLAKDMVHPNDNGHYAIAALVNGYLEKLLELSVCDYSETKYDTHLTNSKYLNARIYYPHDLEPTSRGCFNIEDVHLPKMPYGWIARENGEPLEYNFKDCRRVFVLFEKTNRGDGGKATVDVNGEKFEFDADFKDGWGLYSNHIMVFDSETPSDVCLKVIPNLEEGKEFTVIGIMVS